MAAPLVAFSTACGPQLWYSGTVVVAYELSQGFPHSSVGKESACSAVDPGSNPGLGRSPGEGNGNPLQYSPLENPMDRCDWWATDHRIAKNQTQLK